MLHETRTKPIQHKNCDGMSLKMLDEQFARDQMFIQHDFSSSNMVFSFLLFLRSVEPIQHFIQHSIFVILDEMLDRFNKAFI